ncbi:MAG: choice-of-anchor Q domain-containing protein [Planctomycetota bacterium]
MNMNSCMAAPACGLGGLVGAALAVGVLAGTAGAQLVVTSLADGGVGTLREAIAQAEASPGLDEILFGVSGEIVLTETLPIINEDLTIDASGRVVTVSGGNAVRVFIVDGGDVIMRGFSIVDGAPESGSGGGIDHNAGTLTVEDMVFRGNTTTRVGAGIVSSSDAEMLTVRRCTFDDNSAIQSGALHIADTNALIEDSVFTNNTALFQFFSAAGLGGATAIFNSSVQIRNTVYDGNRSERTAGTISASNSTVHLTDVEIRDSRSEDDGGASQFVAGADITYTRCLLVGNSCDRGPGLMQVQDIGTRVTIIDSMIADNRTNGGGGAIAVPAGTLVVRGSTFFDNHARVDGGAINVNRVGGRLEMSNTTVSGNTAERSGGGISIGADATAIIDSSTIAFNTAQNSGGGLNVSGSVVAPVELGNTIFAGNTAIGNPGAPDIIGSQITSLGFNLYENPGPAVTVMTDLLGADADLQPLAENGGPAPTHGLGEASEAIDAGSTALEVDQRGLPRPFGAGVDIGAIERTVIPDVDLAGPVETVDVFDVAAFLEIVRGNDVEAGDLTRDGEVTITDVRLFLRVVAGL